MYNESALHYRLLTIVIFIFTLATEGLSQTVAKNDSTTTLITATLNDGTKVWGILQIENKNDLIVSDFNLGKIRLELKNILNIEKKIIESAVVIETINNASYFGRIVDYNEKYLILTSEFLDTFEIQCNTIAKISASTEFVSKKGGNWFANPNATRYFFAPSAIPLKKKEGYYQNAYLLANSVNIGLSDKITIGGGVVIPLLFYVTPKVSYEVRKNLYLGGGILFTQSFLTEFHLSAGIGYGLITLGNRENNFTVGCGYGISKFDSEYKATKMPIITLNGMSRIGKRLSLVTENWMIPRSSYNIEQTVNGPDGMSYIESIKVSKNYYTPVISLGMRIMPTIKTSIDFSVVGMRLNPDGNDLILPYLDFVYKF